MLKMTKIVEHMLKNDIHKTHSKDDMVLYESTNVGPEECLHIGEMNASVTSEQKLGYVN